MCGIVGIYRHREGHNDSSIVRTMAKRIQRRGPDGQGFEIDGPATLGNQRLAILDLSDAGHMPMRSIGGRYVVTFNGEIYNYQDLRRDLGVDDHLLRSSSDTEILLLAWQRWGPAALDRMVGQWAFALYDNLEKKLWLARDRFGEKPLFYHRSSDALSFASSISALLAVPWIPRKLDRSALAEFVTLRYVVSPRTVLTGIHKLPPGHYLEATAEKIQVQRWYEPRFQPGTRRARLKRNEVAEQFGAYFLQATKRCLVSDVPVALLLSNGIDSQSIAAALSLVGSDVARFTYRPSESASAGVQNTNANGNNTLIVTPSERVQTMLPAFGALTEPVGDGASLATWLLIRSAREAATVFLCGHGGDEVLGGYRLSQDRFRLSVLHGVARLPKRWLYPVAQRFLYGSESTDARLGLLRGIRRSEVPAIARYLIHRPLPPADVHQLFDSEPMPASNGLGVIDELYAQCRKSATDLDRMQEVMLRTFLSENILCFADSVAMDSSAELRMPFLDRDLVEFVLSLPPASRVSRWPGRANTKLALRWWGEKNLPKQTVKRRKRTFNFGNLPQLLHTHGKIVRGYVLDSTAVRQALPGVEKWVNHPPEYFRGPWEGTLWALLALGIWCENAGVR